MPTRGKESSDSEVCKYMTGETEIFRRTAKLNELTLVVAWYLQPITFSRYIGLYGHLGFYSGSNTLHEIRKRPNDEGETHFFFPL